MKLQVIVAAMALMLGTTAFADMTVTTTTTKVASTHQHRHHHMHHPHHMKHHRHHMHHRGKQVVKQVVVHEEMSPPGSVTVIK